MRRIKAIYLAPVLAIIALLAWALASPVGAAPDDDFHLVSTWCAVEGDYCAPGTAPNNREVPEGLLDASCYAHDPESSAGCQGGVSFDPENTQLTDRGNFVGAYPPVYYAFMHLFVGSDIILSALVMRIVSILIFVGLTTALFVLLPVQRRSTLIWMWLISTMPMGIFLLSSNNPSGWAVLGVGSAWLALLGYLETTGKRKWALGGIFALATIMASGARGDAALYAVIGIGAVFLLTAPWKAGERTPEKWKRYAKDAILPAVMTVLCFAFFVLSTQTQAGVIGFGGEAGGSSGSGDVTGEPEAALSGFGLLAYNLLNVPFLWAGNFGEWGLGWLDTAMPAIVPFGAIAVLVGVGITGLGKVWDRKLLVVIACAATLWILPVYVLWQGGNIIGEAVQPRYLLPLIVLFAGLLMLERADKQVRFTRVQLLMVGAVLAGVNLVAMHMNLRRYLTGVDQPGLNLDHDYEWWWSMPVSPMFVWIIGSAAYLALVTVLLGDISKRDVHASGVSRPRQSQLVL